MAQEPYSFTHILPLGYKEQHTLPSKQQIIENNDEVSKLKADKRKKKRNYRNSHPWTWSPYPTHFGANQMIRTCHQMVWERYWELYNYIFWWPEESETAFLHYLATIEKGLVTSFLEYAESRRKQSIDETSKVNDDKQERHRLHAYIYKLEINNNQHDNQLKALHDLWSSTCARNTELAEQIKDIGQENSNLKEEMDLQKRDSESMSVQNSTLAEQLEQLVKENTSLKEESKSCSNHNIELAGKVELLDKENDTIQAQIEEQLKENERLIQQMQDLSDKINQLENENTSLKMELEEHEMKDLESNTKLEENAAILENATRELKDQKDQIAELQCICAHNCVLEEQIKYLDKVNACLKEEMDLQKGNCESKPVQNSALAEQMEQLVKENTNLKEKYESKSVQNSTLAKQMEQLVKENTNLKKEKYKR